MVSASVLVNATFSYTMVGNVESVVALSMRTEDEAVPFEDVCPTKCIASSRTNGEDRKITATGRERMKSFTEERDCV